MQVGPFHVKHDGQTTAQFHTLNRALWFATRMGHSHVVHVPQKAAINARHER